MMDEAAAQEFSEAFGQIGSGWWRQVAWAQRQGIPAALGLDVKDWVEQYVGGHMRLRIDERREAVAELSAEGMSQREIAGVLGIGETTVRETRQEGASADPEALRDQWNVRKRAHAPEDQEATTTDQRSMEDYASAGALRDAAVLRVKAAIQGAAAAIEAVTPPIEADEAEAEGLTATASYILRQLNRGRKLEAVK